jgi:hypothetical protein
MQTNLPEYYPWKESFNNMIKSADKIINKTECIRCGAVIEDNEGGTDAAGNDYCECCYDDLFVSWNDVLKETN